MAADTEVVLQTQVVAVQEGTQAKGAEVVGVVVLAAPVVAVRVVVEAPEQVQAEQVVAVVEA